MLFEKRTEKILELLQQKKTVTIQEFSESLGVSDSTIRRDLIALEENGRLRRIHGGATTVTNLGKEQKMIQKEAINQDAKKTVAAYAASFVKPDSQIYIDAGTATLELVRLLPDNLNVHVMTNGVDHALTALQKGIDVTILGGQIKPNTHAIAGMATYQQLEKMNFAYAFMGMNGIHAESGLTTTNIDEAILKELAMKQSQHIRILMDDSKVNQIYEFKVDVPSQAIILLNEEAQQEHSGEIKQLIKKYDLDFVNEQR